MVLREIVQTCQIDADIAIEHVCLLRLRVVAVKSYRGCMLHNGLRRPFGVDARCLIDDPRKVNATFPSVAQHVHALGVVIGYR